jgi:hypothetical protein
MTEAYGGIGGGAISEYAIAETGGEAPSLLDMLRAGDYAIVIIQEMRAAGSSLVYRMYLSDTVWTTLPTDSLPNMTLGGEITAGPVVSSTVSFGPGAQNNGEQSGSVDLLVHPDGVPVETEGYGISFQGLTRIRREKVVGGWPTRILIGYPAYGLDSFTTVWVGVGDDLAGDGVTKAKLTFRDNRAALSRGVLSAFAGTGGAEGTAEIAGQLKPRHYGAPKNVTPVLVDPVNSIYFASDRAATSPLSAAYDGAKEYTEDATVISTYAGLVSHSVSAGTWAQARVSGVGTFVKLNASPSKRLTVDFADTLTVPQIIRAVLETAGVASSAIIIETEGYPFGSGTDHSAKWQTIQDVIQNDAAGYLYVSDQATPNDIVDGLCKGIGWSRYLDDFGRERFTSPDYALADGAVSGVDYTLLSAGESTTITNPDGSSYLSFAGGDILTLREPDLPGTMWPPNGRERLLANKNHSAFTENDVLDGAADAKRQYVMKGGDEQTVESASDIFAALKTAVDPDALDTHIVDKTYLPDLGDWLLLTSALSDGRGAPNLYLTKRQIFEVVLPMPFYATLRPFGTVKFDHPTYYGDSGVNVVGQSMPVETDWQARTRTLYVYAQSQQYASLWLGEVEGPTPGTSLSAASDVAVIGNYALVTCYGRASIAVFDVSDPASPVWVTEVRGPSPGTSLLGAQRITVAGSYAYVACFVRSSMAVIDVSNPASPTWVAEIRGPVPGTSMAGARDVSVSGGYACVACVQSQAVALIDVSNPASPAWVTAISGGTTGGAVGEATSAAISGSYVYIVCNVSDNLVVMDVSTPSSPVVAGQTQGPEPGESLADPSRIVVSGTRAYATSNARSSFAVIDISTPSAPEWVSETRGPTPGTSLGGPFDIALSGLYAYVTASSGSVAVIDISEPDSLSWVTEVRGPVPGTSLSSAMGLGVGDTGVFVALYDRSSLAVIA